MSNGTNIIKNEMRDFETDGVATSGPHKPIKSNIRIGLDTLAADVAAAALAGGDLVAAAALIAPIAESAANAEASALAASNATADILANVADTIDAAVASATSAAETSATNAATSAQTAQDARDIAQAAVGVDYADSASALSGAVNGDRFTYWNGDEIVFAKKEGGVIVVLDAPWFDSDKVNTAGGVTVQTALRGLDNGTLHFETPDSATISAVDIAYYAQQGGASPIAGAIHDYTDASRTLQLDKVGGDIALANYVIGVRRASNHIRRTDKDGTYVSASGFLRCSYDQFTQTASFTGEINGTTLTVTAVSSGTIAAGNFLLWEGTDNGTTVVAQLTGAAGGVGTYSLAVRGNSATTQTVASTAMTAKVKNEVLAFYIGKAGDFGWSTDRVQMTTGYTGGLYAYTFKASGVPQYVASFESASGQVLNIQDAVAGTRTDIVIPSGQTSGLRFDATAAGGIDIAPKAATQVTIREKVVPGTHNAYYIGTSAANWLRVYSDAYYVGAVKVLGAQGAAVADAVAAAGAPTQTEFNNLVTQFNALLARCRAHGIIAT